MALLGPLARFSDTSAAWLDYPYPRPGSEGLILYESLLVKRGGDPYAPITPERFISGPYPPIYYWLAAATLPQDFPDWSDPGKVTSVFQPGRTISLLAALLAAVLILVLVVADGGYAAKGRRAILLAGASGALGGALFLSLPQTLVWATRFRGDMLMIALTAGGLVCVASGVRGQGSGLQQPSGDNSGKATSARAPGPWSLTPDPWLLLGACSFALAFYTKQTALAGPGAAALYLLLRDWRVGLRWCGVMALAVIVPFVALDVATGHWFYLKMVDYHSLPLSRLTLARLLEFAFWEDQWPLIVAAVGYGLIRLWAALNARREKRGAGAPSLIALFMLAALATLPTGAVVGADHNHLLMSGLAISAGTGGLLAWALVRLEPGRGNLLARVIAPVTLLLLLIHATMTSAPSTWYGPDLGMPGAAEQEQLRKIVLNVRQNPGSVFFADDPGIPALAGKETPYDDPFTMTALALQGRWDESAYVRMLREGKFGLLVLSCDVINRPDLCRADTLTPGVKDAIRDGYQLLFRDVFFTYAPK
jgi:MFS family permease